MGRHAMFPTTVEDLRVLNLRFLSDNKYLQLNSFQSGIVSWKSNAGNDSSISISTNMSEKSGVLTLHYALNSERKINYQIKLISKTSNLGIGLIWFFLCPFTGRYCRKLHLIDGYFQHRTANPHIMYEKQIEPKIWRIWNKQFASEINEHLYFELYSKYFKRYYKGKMTKRYVRLKKKIDEIENSDPTEYFN